jgi:hypothetical protein
MKALHSFETTGYVKLSATQHNITRDENHNYCRILSSHLFSWEGKCVKKYLNCKQDITMLEGPGPF